MPFLLSGHPEVTVTQFLAFVGSFLLEEAEMGSFTCFWEGAYGGWLALKSLLLVGLDSWAWNESKSLTSSLVFRVGYLVKSGRDYWQLATGFIGCLCCHDPQGRW